MNFFNPNVIFEGTVQLDNAPSQSNHAVRKDWVESNAIMAIHTDSSILAETVIVNGSKQLKLKSLAVTDVSVDSTATSLANWISSNYTNGNELQEGDMLILTNTAANRTETYIHNGGNAGTSADFTEIEGSDVSASEVRSLLSASSGVSYNSSTGEFTANQGQIRGFFTAGSGLGYDDANGVFSLTADTDGVSEGASNLYFTDARAQAAISVSGAGLSKTGGAISLTADTDNISEGSSNLYFTQARARGAVQADPATGNLLSYASATGNITVATSSVFAQFSAGSGLAFSNGQYSLTADTDGVSEGSSNLYFTDARAQAAISVSGAGLSKTGGAISLTADTDDISEGSTNQYFTDARARGAVSVDSTVQNQLLSYDSSTGKFSVDMDDLRKEFANQSLTANTFATLNHGLGKKFVHVSAYDANDNLVMLDVQLTDANNLKVKSGSNKTGLKIVISI
jgi:hypothetical protein